ncbi:MAG: 16S rRNA (adenine(1518)-N(6)/adenine(1519)-N(6))-dimethyltransferase RsmA [Verrucomicrobiota bacterium]
MKLSEMKQVLAERGWKLTKSLGQNFLHDHNQLRRMIAAAQLGPGDKVLEIGPGLGPLTELLIAQAGEVLAIEKDQRLFDFLAQKLAGAPNLKLLRADAVEHLKTGRRWGGWKLVANLPYAVASTLLVELAEAEAPPDRMVATLQLEVAQRLDAPTGSGQYGVFGLLLRLRYQLRGWFKIPASCFFPAPDVDSACVTLERRTEPLLPAALEAPFTRIVKRGFSQRRKMMRKLLKEDFPEDRVLTAFQRLGLSPQIRAEEVSLEQFARLTQMLAQ